MKHERSYRLTALCELCDGRKRLICGAISIDCPECDGAGEVEVEPVEELEAADA